MLVILDNTPRLVFRRPGKVITAHAAAEVPGALAAIAEALAAGKHVAGWLGYELGYALEPRLAPLMPVAPGPLLELGVFDAPETEAPRAPGRAYAGPLALEWNAQDYRRRFAQVKDYIAAGDIYQANLSFRAGFAFAGDPLALYQRLKMESGAGHCAFFDNEERQILSLSPELFFDLAADGALTARPMKGTMARGPDDSGERAALAASEKDRAENLMIVDLIRNDLGRIAETGSVAVKDLFRVESYPTLHTMVSTVTAQKRRDAGVADIIAALFPCGSVTGAPKIRAMAILRELESSPRGAYCGAIGYFAPAPDGNISARFNVAIRSLTIRAGRGELGIGGGVVQDSQANSEYAECLLKARFFETARQPLELIETMRFEERFIRLEAHLARMRRSALTFGLVFNHGSAHTVLNEAVVGKEGALRVRLTLNEAGEHKAVAAPLPPNPPGWSYEISPAWVTSSDLFQQHKTSWRQMYERETARLGTDEVVFLNERGEVAEGARSNVFVMRPDGFLYTPPLSAGALPGILRAELLARGEAREATLKPEDLGEAHSSGFVFFGNSLRGLVLGARA
jgi:para-aminobenzoate synthetase / 4-amino-4-deoxychorismate lyase